MARETRIQHRILKCNASKRRHNTEVLKGNGKEGKKLTWNGQEDQDITTEITCGLQMLHVTPRETPVKNGRNLAHQENISNLEQLEDLKAEEDGEKLIFLLGAHNSAS